MKRFILSLAVIGALGLTNAQVKTPQPSPSSTVQQTVGLSEITVNYSRPSMKERKIFGDLVPMDKVWRTGANGSTDIEFSSDANFGGVDIKAGKYALYTIPSEDFWVVMLYADTEIWGDPGKDFDKSKVVAETKVKAMTIKPDIESFTIGFDDLRNGSANLTLTWESTYVKVPIKVDYRKEVEESIKKVMAGPSANDYNSAASFYLEEGTNLDEALEFAKKAEELKPDAFWMIKTQSEIYAAKGDYKNAIATAERSLKLAEKANYAPYIKMNKENIAKWQKMK